MPKQIEPMSVDRMIRLTASGVAKVDLMGPRGTTLCTMDEIEAMALMIVASGILPGHPADAARQPHYPELEKDKR